ncbi:hypothetical protein L7F22_022903 [Adiantum nelumboides]|nr:hypothetical protein [Adiantum nelumboides]
MDGNKEEGFSSEDRQPISIAHEIGKSLGQAEEALQKLSGDEKIKLLFISESNVCRSVYAEAMFNNFVKEKGLQDIVECSSKGTRDYNEGEKPDGNVLEVAGDLGLDISDHSATVFDCARDVVVYDMLLVMDKFTASDVLRDVTLFETIDKNNDYCWKVRRLGEFCLGRKVDDIDDPLYGNVGGEEEVEELHRVALDIHESCNGLLNFLTEIQSSLQETETPKQALARTMGQMAPTEWIRPPMLQNS